MKVLAQNLRDLYRIDFPISYSPHEKCSLGGVASKTPLDLLSRVTRLGGRMQVWGKM